MNISKEQVEQVLSTLDGPTIEVTVRRGGNLHLTFEQLKNVKALMDNNGEELESRDEVIMRAQIKAKEALKNAGIHCRISNSRLVDGTWVHSPSMWVNNTPRPGAATTATPSKETQQLKAELNELKGMMAQFLSAVNTQAKSEQSQNEPPI